MATRKTHFSNNTLFFCNVTCYNWINLFEITNLYDHIYRWFDLLKSKEIKITGYVIMPNHFHILIYIPGTNISINKIISNCKRFMAYEIIKRLEEKGNTELLLQLQNSVKVNELNKGKLHNVFQPSFDAKSIITEKFLIQKLNYIHFNPVRGKWKLVEDYRNYDYSSAGFYELENFNGYKITHYAEL